MTRRGRRVGAFSGAGVVVAVAAAALVACQPLPHPFADDRPPAALLEIRDSPGVAVTPVVGQPAAIAPKLAPAMAQAFLKRDIPASDRTTNLESYQLYGRLAQSRTSGGKSSVTALWRLYNAKGRTVGERTVKLDGDTREWQTGGDAAVDRLAAASTDALASLLEDKAPAAATAAAAAPADTGRIRIAVDKISGAPGDGAASLKAAVEAVLKQQQNLTVIDAGGGKPDLLVAADVAVTPAKPGQQHLKIVWHVRRAGGAGGEIGTVGQENDVPKGTLNDAWGDLAYNIAIAAGDGLMQLVEHAGAPAPKT